MSFEAVPCMFKQRQEDGAEVGLFGLLIRPSPSSSSNLMPPAEGQKQEQPTPSSSSASPTADQSSPITALSTLAGPSSVQIVPGDAKKNDHQNLNTKRTQQRPIAFLGPQTVQRRPGGPFPLLAPPGMPPILPRPKKGAQRGTMPILGMGTGAKLIVPITTSAAMCKTDNAAQSPSQVVPQIGAAGGQVDFLSIATTSSASTSSASSISPSSNNSPPLAVIPSPSAAKREKGGKKQQKRTTKTEGKGQGGKSTSANSKRRRPQKEKGARESADQQQNAPLEGPGGMLGEDLHSIEFSQLVNSTVITTEDYLPSQSEPIYTNLDNLDMYNPGHGPPCPQQQSHPNALRPLPQSLSNHHFNDPAISVPPAPVHGHHPQPPQLCPSAIYLHNQQHFPCPSHSSQVRFVGPPNGQIPYAPPSSGQPSALHSQSNGANQPSWHPYLVAHPGGSHISSTPDSGIQSIDGSPPSVYTPPMVSPYASQVRSCESVGANGHCSSNAGSLLNAHPPPQVTAYSLPHSTAQMNGMYQGETTLLLMSTNGNGPLAAHSSMQMPPIQQQLAPPPPRLIGHGMRENQQGGGIGQEEGRGNGGEEGEEEDGPDDFSDMPKLVPVTNLEHDEAMIEAEGGRGEEQKAALAEEEQRANGQPTTESAESPSKSATPNAGEVFFNAEMNLQELAECLSSRMPPEQLKQLTSLIQSKAANCANKNPPLVEHIGGGGEKSAGKLGAEKEQQKRKEKKANNCEVQRKKGSSKSAAEKAKKKEKMVTSSKKPAELKTKCENLDAKVNSKERPPAKWALKEKEEEERERIAQVIEHRRQVKVQLGRKLEEFTEKVRQQIERTNLNIRNEYWPEKGKILALRRMDWEEVEKRMERKRKEMEGKEPKRRGRKRREENGKREIGRRKGGNLNEEERMKAGRKRRAGGGEECPREGGKRARMSRQKAEEKQGEKQRTPPIILKLPNLLNRKKNHPSIRPPPPSNDAMGACKPQKQMESKASTSCPADNCIRQNRKEMPSPPPLFAHQLAIIRAGHWFLPRNLKRKEIGEMRKERRGTNEGDSIELAKLLAQIFDDFGEICRQKGVPKRHLHHFQRTLGMLFHSESSPSPALLLDRFDGLVKQMISSLKIANLRMAYLQLKRSANFGLLHPQLQKDHLQMFTEDRRRSLHPLHQSPSSPSKRLDSALIPQRPLTVDTNLDLSYMDSEHPVGRWDPDKEAKLSPNSDNRDHDCVRCICGMAEDDGVMTQCDGCHFWLHADCLDNPVNEDQEYICDFCTRRLETTPRVDIVLRPQPSIKFSGCTYFRTLVNCRGLQIRLNEAIYVERLINDKHKRILRELHEECVRKQQPPQTSPIQSPLKNGKGGGRKWTIEGERGENGERQANEWWTEEAEARADRSEFHRRDLRVFRVERLFISPNGQRFIFGCYYARPHETFCDSSRMFYRNELFWTPLFDTLPLDSVVGRCLILEPQIWATGRPKSPRYLEEDVYCCEYQIDRNQRSFEKIQPKNRYYINTEPYVFNTFPEKSVMKRDFTPFQMGGIEAEGANAMQNNSPQKQQSTAISALAFRKRLHQENLEMVCKRIGQKRGKRKEDEQN